MKPCGKEMQALLNQQQQQRSQTSLEDLQNGQHQQMTAASNFDPTSSHDDFLDQMLSGLRSSWPDLSTNAGDYCDDQSTFLASKLQQHQISTAGNNSQEVAAKMLLLQQQLLLSSRGLTDGLHSLSGDFPLDLANSDSFDHSQSDNIFKSMAGEDNSVQAFLNGFSESLTTNNQTQQFQNPPNFGGLAAATTTGMNQAPPNGSSGAPSQPRQRVRARRGQATDPHSIAERLRRERIAERMKALQELVPNTNKTDKASMLDEIIDYVKFLQLQVKVLSMSRLGGAGAIAPLVANISSEGGGDCAAGNGGGRLEASSSNDNTMTVTEHQVAKLMEDDMGSAMQYLQGKGLCLMPISLATAISTSTSCHHPLRNNNHHPLLKSNNAENGGPSSPGRSALSVKSATMAPTNGFSENSVKDATSISKG